MLYKHSFSILCGYLNLNQKRKKIEFGRVPVKPTGYQSNRPVNRSNRPVYRSEPIARRILNSNLNLTSSDRLPAKPDRYTGTGLLRFGRTGREGKPWFGDHRLGCNKWNKNRSSRVTVIEMKGSRPNAMYYCNHHAASFCWTSETY